MNPRENVVVGIDLGTTNSLVARVVDGQPQVVTDAAGAAVALPSAVSFTDDNIGKLLADSDSAPSPGMALSLVDGTV